MELTKKQLIELVQFATGKIHSSFTWESEAEDTVDEYLKAINYTHCSTQLEEFDGDNFEDWIIANGYAVFDDYYLKNDIAFSESDLIDIYNKEVMNL